MFQARAHVQAELFPASQRARRGERQQSTRAPVQTRTRPDCSPLVARDQFLKLTRELGGFRDSRIHVVVAERLPAHLITSFQSITGSRNQEIKERARE